ncbi:hypothetical protein [Roseburia sp. OM04-10AA]|uniref:hypothetical protein n=1 Tax=Roseburia sp. OM04-10AA TaxID=2293141 RepID=UPI000E4FAF1E|nr:hypothetical protein [Roseburia sp. OM04-10AA]RHV56169.1 hypothetical protein DXB42_12600 [Roseburia sp. OM04-10AA]
MGFFGNLFKSEFEKWVEGASHEELSEAYEEERQDWIKNGFNGGTGEKTPKMNRLNKEISKRVAEEWENDPRRNKDPTSVGQMLIVGIRIKMIKTPHHRMYSSGEEPF